MTYGGKYYVWGGVFDRMPLVHSTLNVFSFATQQWTQQQTTGDPPRGTDSASVAQLGDKVLFFGGCDSRRNHLQNTVHELNMTTFRWREVTAENPGEAPSCKRSCGCVAFTYNEEYLCAFGGIGLMPNIRQAGAFYFPNPVQPQLVWNNELHLLNLQHSKCMHVHVCMMSMLYFIRI